jgi:hypothetical protein
VVDDLGGIKRGPQLRTEDESTLLPRLTSLQLHLGLTKAVLLELFDYHWSKHNAPSTLLGFWFRLDVPVARSMSENMAHLKCIVLEVDILPLERQDFTSTHPGDESQHKERFK